jgi:DNA-binding MarR family transcriptional regulator
MDDAEEASAVAVLKALRAFRAADSAMRERAQAELHLGENDLAAVRHLIRAELQGAPVSPTDLSAQLGISSAATAKLLHRLAATGHIRREPNAVDRRAQVIHVTPSAHREVRQNLGSVHQRMLDVARTCRPPSERRSSASWGPWPRPFRRAPRIRTGPTT